MVPGPPLPRLAGCLGYVDCVPWARSDGGDHVLHLGRVVDIGPGDGEPLVFYRGGFTGLDTPAGRVPARTPQGCPPTTARRGGGPHRTEVSRDRTSRPAQPPGRAGPVG
ncbi:flavin reductase family protein [Micromonospora echinospora]|uniref:flavin reductase family protein n=1 Tax=Micromonospora echinospora TaxID=1877 RepID=UPI003A849D69